MTDFRRVDSPDIKKESSSEDSLRNLLKTAEEAYLKFKAANPAADSQALDQARLQSMTKTLHSVGLSKDLSVVGVKDGHLLVADNRGQAYEIDGTGRKLSTYMVDASSGNVKYLQKNFESTGHPYGYGGPAGSAPPESVNLPQPSQPLPPGSSERWLTASNRGNAEAPLFGNIQNQRGLPSIIPEPAPAPEKKPAVEEKPAASSDNDAGPRRTREIPRDPFQPAQPTQPAEPAASKDQPGKAPSSGATSDAGGKSAGGTKEVAPKGSAKNFEVPDYPTRETPSIPSKMIGVPPRTLSEKQKEKEKLVYDEQNRPDASELVSRFGVPGSDAEIAKRAEKIERNYGPDTIVNVSNRIALCNALPAELRRELTGSSDPIDARKAEQYLYESRLGNSPYKFLLAGPPQGKSLEQQVDDKIDSEKNAVAEFERRAEFYRNQVDNSVRILQMKAENGYIASWMEPAIVGGPGLLEGLNQDRHRVEQNNLQLGQSSQRLESLTIGQQAYEHQQLLNSGQQRRADQRALEILGEHGSGVINFCGKLNEQLTAKDDRGRTALERLHAAGLAQVPELPDMPTQSNESLARGLNALKRIGELPDSGFADLAVRRKDALEALDSDPTLNAFSQSARTLGPNLNHLSDLAQAGANGFKSVEYVTAFKEVAQAVGNQLNKSPEDIKELNDKIVQMKAALKDVNDDAAHRLLEHRIQGLEGLAKIYDGNSEQGKKLRELCALASSPDFTQDTASSMAWKWVKQEGPALAGAIAATALVVVTAGEAAPLALAARSTVAWMLGGGTVNVALDTYKLTGNETSWGQQNRANSTLGDYLMTSPSQRSFFNQVLAPIGTEFVINTGLAIATMGIVKYGPVSAASRTVSGSRQMVSGAMQIATPEGRQVFQQAFGEFLTTSPSAKKLAETWGRAEMASSGSAEAKGFLKQWMEQFPQTTMFARTARDLTGFTVATEAATNLLVDRTEAGNSWLAFGIPIALSIAQHKLSVEQVRMGKGNRWEVTEAAIPELIEQYSAQGYKTRRLSTGDYEVRTKNGVAGETTVVVGKLIPESSSASGPAAPAREGIASEGSRGKKGTENVGAARAATQPVSEVIIPEQGKQPAQSQDAFSIAKTTKLEEVKEYVRSELREIEQYLASCREKQRNAIMPKFEKLQKQFLDNPDVVVSREHLETLKNLQEQAKRGQQARATDTFKTDLVELTKSDKSPDRFVQRNPEGKVDPENDLYAVVQKGDLERAEALLQELRQRNGSPGPSELLQELKRNYQATGNKMGLENLEVLTEWHKMHTPGTYRSASELYDSAAFKVLNKDTQESVRKHFEKNKSDKSYAFRLAIKGKGRVIASYTEPTNDVGNMKCYDQEIRDGKPVGGMIHVLVNKDMVVIDIKVDEPSRVWELVTGKGYVMQPTLLDSSGKPSKKSLAWVYADEQEGLVHRMIANADGSCEQQLLDIVNRHAPHLRKAQQGKASTTETPAETTSNMNDRYQKYLERLRKMEELARRAQEMRNQAKQNSSAD